MSHLEDQLRSALGRKEPGVDFTQRVMSRVGPPAPRSWREGLRVLLRPPRLQWVAASLAVSLMVPFGALEYRREREIRARGQMAKQKLILAVRITGTELHHAQQKISRISQLENQ